MWSWLSACSSAGERCKMRLRRCMSSWITFEGYAQSRRREYLRSRQRGTLARVGSKRRLDGQKEISSRAWSVLL